MTNHDLTELLAALKAGEMTETVRTSLAWVLQALIEAEVTAVIGAEPHERSEYFRDLGRLPVDEQGMLNPADIGKTMAKYATEVIR